MGLKQGETEYKLTDSLSYSAKGQFVDGEKLVLREPKIQHARRALALQQMIKKSEVEAAATISRLGLMDSDIVQEGLKAGEKTPDIETLAEQWERDSQAVVEQVEMQIMQSSIDVYDFANTFWKMADQKPSICLIDGTEPMKEGYREKMSVHDYLGAPLWYCSFFVILSGRERKNLSNEPQKSV